MPATMEPSRPRPRPWQVAGPATAAAPGPMPCLPAAARRQQQQQHLALSGLQTVPPPPQALQPHAAATWPPYATSAAAVGGAAFGLCARRGVVVPLSQQQPQARPTVQAAYFELQPPLRTSPGPRPAPTQGNPNSGGVNNTPSPSTVAASVSMLIGGHKQQRPEDEEKREGRIVQRRRVGPPPVAHGWVLMGDRVLRVARQAWEGTMGALLNERRFGRRQAEGFMHMMEGFARGNRQRGGPTADPSAGIISALRSLLGSGPALDAGTDGGGAVVPLAFPPSHRHPSREDALANPYDALYRRLAQDEGACYLIEESVHGQRTVRCSARMADMFISTEELQGLVDQTGLAVGHLMLRLVESPHGVERLARDLAAMCFDKYGGKNTFDAQVKCQTRTGQPVRCLATIGVFIDDVGRHVLIFRLWPLVTRDLLVAPKTKQQAPPQPQPQPQQQPLQAQQQGQGYVTYVDSTFARSDTPTTTAMGATGLTTAGDTHSTDSSSGGSSGSSAGSMSDTISSSGGGGGGPHPPFYHYYQRQRQQQQQQHPTASAAARAAHISIFVPRPLVYDAHGRRVLPSTTQTRQDKTRATRAPKEEHKADEQLQQQVATQNWEFGEAPTTPPQLFLGPMAKVPAPAPPLVPTRKQQRKQQQRRQQQQQQRKQQQGVPLPAPMVGASSGDDVVSLTSVSVSSGVSSGVSTSSTSSSPVAAGQGSPAAVVASDSPPQRQQPGKGDEGTGAAVAAVPFISLSTSSSGASEAEPEGRREQPEGQSLLFLERLKLTSDEGDVVSALLGMRGRVGPGSSPVR